MKVIYNSKTDIFTIILKDNVSVEESEESKPGVILDYDKEGSLVSLEVLNASEGERNPQDRVSNFILKAFYLLNYSI
jgi:uncharacterized protein YuzE